MPWDIDWRFYSSHHCASVLSRFVFRYDTTFFLLLAAHTLARKHVFCVYIRSFPVRNGIAWRSGRLISNIFRAIFFRFSLLHESSRNLDLTRRLPFFFLDTTRTFFFISAMLLTCAIDRLDLPSLLLLLKISCLFRWFSVFFPPPCGLGSETCLAFTASGVEIQARGQLDRKE